jgi:calcineurin-like phosphoesterase family protein
MIFLWADTHFNHEGIIRLANRPYGSVEEMNRDLIRRWNLAVGPRDTVYLLGDFGFNRRGSEPLSTIFAALNGHKHLVVGNHDEKNPRVLQLPWESTSDLVTLREEGVRAVACHYPLETWKSGEKGYLMVHGHSHGTLARVLPRRFDVGVEVEPFPVALSALAARAVNERFEATDHHGAPRAF